LTRTPLMRKKNVEDLGKINVNKIFNFEPI